MSEKLEESVGEEGLNIYKGEEELGKNFVCGLKSLAELPPEMN